MESLAKGVERFVFVDHLYLKGITKTRRRPKKLLIVKDGYIVATLDCGL
jgi:hypothetical protein